MPAKTTDQLQEKARALRKKLAEKGDSMDQAKTRALKKRIRRVQRRRRSLLASAARKSGKAEAKSE